MKLEEKIHDYIISNSYLIKSWSFLKLRPTGHKSNSDSASIGSFSEPSKTPKYFLIQVMKHPSKAIPCSTCTSLN